MNRLVIMKAQAHETEELPFEALLTELFGAPFRAPEGALDGLCLAELSRCSVEDIGRRLGLTRARARRLRVAFSIGRCTERARLPGRPYVGQPDRVHALLAPELRGLQRECFHVLLLDGKHRLRSRELVSVGTLTGSLVHPREVFRAAVREGAAAIVVAHNHPSGDPEPSSEDVEVTRRLAQAGRWLGVPLLDHVVIGAARWVSLRERQLL